MRSLRFASGCLPLVPGLFVLFLPRASAPDPSTGGSGGSAGGELTSPGSGDDGDHGGELAAPGVSHRHGLMIDAGSEGSRIVLFRWNTIDTAWPDETLVTPVAIGNFSTAPGIGSFALHPSGAGDSLSPLIDYAKKKLEHLSEHWHEMPLWLRATAGMRLLHADERELVLDDVRSLLSKSGFLFRDSHAVVITGEEEGIYGWITVNYHLGAFNKSVVSEWNTIGALDLGGASAQIVFMPEKSILQHAFPLHLGAHRLRVYSYSFLHFGMREASHRMADLIISAALEQVQSVDKLKHPCFSMGYTYEPRFAYSDNRTFPMEVQMQGSSNFQTCHELMERIFMKSAPCLVQTCSFYGVYQPHVYSSQFIAFSHFSDVATHLALPHDARLLDLKIASEYVCSLSLDQLNVIFARVKSQYDRLHLCFHSAYVYALLTFGYGFQPETRQIKFKGTLDDDVMLDYVSGALIFEINRDPWLVQKADTQVMRQQMASQNENREADKIKETEEQVVRDEKGMALKKEEKEARHLKDEEQEAKKDAERRRQKEEEEMEHEIQAKEEAYRKRKQKEEEEKDHGHHGDVLETAGGSLQMASGPARGGHDDSSSIAGVGVDAGVDTLFEHRVHPRIEGAAAIGAPVASSQEREPERQQYFLMVE